MKNIYILLCLVLLLGSCAVKSIDESNTEESNDTNDQQVLTDDLVSKSVTGTDLKVSRVYVNNYTSNQIWYEVDITNNGTVSIPLKNIYFQAYIHRSGETDIPAGATRVGFAGDLGPGETVTKSFAPNISINLTKLTTDAYLKIVVDPNNYISEVFEGKYNTRAVLIPPYKPDLYGYNGKATLSADKKKITYSAYIKNRGLTTANTENVVIQAVLSTNTTIDVFDKSCGGFKMTHCNIDSLARDEIGVITFAASTDPSWFDTPLILLIQIDKTNIINEYSETNNIIQATIFQQ